MTGAALMNIFIDIAVAIGTLGAAIIAAIAIIKTSQQNKQVSEHNESLINIEKNRLKCNVVLYSDYYQSKLEPQPLCEIYRRGIDTGDENVDSIHDDDSDNDEGKEGNNDKQKYKEYAGFCIKNHGEAILKEVNITFAEGVVRKYLIVLGKNEARYVKIGIPLGVEFYDNTESERKVSDTMKIEFISHCNKVTKGIFHLWYNEGKKRYTIKNYSYLGDQETM
jgi:hypothetical protein